MVPPAWATSSFTTVAGQGWLAGVKPTLDALIYVAAAGSAIKGWALAPEFEKRPFGGRSSTQRYDRGLVRNTTLRLSAGISVMTGAENPTVCAIAPTASRSRRPQFGLRLRRFWSNA